MRDDASGAFALVGLAGSRVGRWTPVSIWRTIGDIPLHDCAEEAHTL